MPKQIFEAFKKINIQKQKIEDLTNDYDITNLVMKPFLNANSLFIIILFYTISIRI